MAHLGRLGFVERILRDIDERRDGIEQIILSGRLDGTDYKAACRERTTWIAAREVITAALNDDEKAELRA